MWKQARESGLSLAELLVVLAITVVLAAILLPAINMPNHGAEIVPPESLDAYVATAENDAPAVPQSREERSDAREHSAPKVGEMSAPMIQPVQVMPAFNTSEVQTLERDGLKEFKTTDISYKLP